MEPELELALRSGVRARTLEGLRKQFDLPSVMDAYRSGQLNRWLLAGGYWREADQLRALDTASPSLKASVCLALGLDTVSSAQFVLGLNDPEQSRSRLARLEEATDDPEILESLDCVAFTQEDLDNLAALRLDQIFLCGGSFVLPARAGNILYVGVDSPTVRFGEGSVAPGVDCVDVKFDTSGLVRDFLCWVSLEDHGNYYFPQFWDNLELGVRILTQAADEDDPQAQTLLSVCIRERYGTAGLAAEPEPLMLDTSSALFRAGQSGETRSCAEAAKWALWAAGQGDPAGMCMLANHCFCGLGVPEDAQKADRLNKEAAAIFEERAKDGDAAAQMNLAWCLFYGIGRERDGKRAMAWLKNAADLGLASAQCELADQLLDRDPTDQDRRAAFELYGKAAACGDARGLAGLGDFYYFGDVVPEDEEEAVRLYLAAAEKGSQLAQKRLVECYTEGFGTAPDPGAASYWAGKLMDQELRFRYKYGWNGKTGTVDMRAESKRNFGRMRKRAHAGDADAICGLAWEYIRGNAVGQDFEKARELFRTAFRMGHASSMYGLGLMYERGQGGEPDDARAARCFRNAASHGNVEAMVRLATWYAQGRGVPESQEKAAYWFRQGAEEEYSFAQFALGQRYEYGRGVPQDTAQAAFWYGRAAEQGDTRAQCSLAMMYLQGNGVDASPERAAHWFHRAAAKGNASAQLYLGMMYAQGNGVDQDEEQAARWYAKAAEQGDTLAQNNLGYCYFCGTGVEQNYAKAAGWYERSARQDDPWAMTSLGYCYYNGMGVQQSVDTAMAWFRRAAAMGSEDAMQVLANLEVGTPGE